MILVIDNYDSFTYNLVDMFRLKEDVVVKYPDDDTLYDLQPDALVISPGPGHPDDTTRLHEIIEHFKGIPILGICLGAQALYRYYGGRVVVASKVMHGKIDTLQFEKPTLLYKGFQNILILCAITRSFVKNSRYLKESILPVEQVTVFNRLNIESDRIMAFNIIRNHSQVSRYRAL